LLVRLANLIKEHKKNLSMNSFLFYQISILLTFRKTGKRKAQKSNNIVGFDVSPKGAEL
jgi:hypothetical protein